MSEKGSISVGGNVFHTLNALEKLGGEAKCEEIRAYLGERGIQLTNLNVILWRLWQVKYISKKGQGLKSYALTEKGVIAMERAIDQLTKAF